MILLIGGAYQGKGEYAAEHYPHMETVPRFHLLLLELVKAGESPEAYVKTHLADFKDKVILSDDIFCGVVPTDPIFRQWREESGRALAFLAKEAEEVVRVFCGLGTKIK